MIKNAIAKKTLLALLLITAGIVQAASLKPYTGKITNPQVQLKDLSGNIHTLEQYKGQVVLVQFWATYCPPCVKEMPSMNKLQDKLAKAGVAFKILAIDMAESKAEVEAFVKRIKPEFTILMDESGSSIQAWNVFAAPSNFLINKQGEIAYTLFGGVEWDSTEIIETITQLSQQ
ncbi:MAG: TlpA family protein disulfide reductase [Candidatus Thioglobus sp.]|nr:TlpA family protein disulfide reductase [Candidatus Thioglobus pontius]MBL6977219.1 TlpA family protein disulfide reductase [Candidatus Thioglobus sp.]MBL6984795.1 TlpA family protein disulfide reductase [Candidatus Thioglobus sp.]